MLMLTRPIICTLDIAKILQSSTIHEWFRSFLISSCKLDKMNQFHHLSNQVPHHFVSGLVLAAQSQHSGDKNQNQRDGLLDRDKVDVDALLSENQRLRQMLQQYQDLEANRSSQAKRRRSTGKATLKRKRKAATPKNLEGEDADIGIGGNENDDIIKDKLKSVRKPGKKCCVINCDRLVKSRKLCIRHGGGRRCSEPGCKKGAEGATYHCIGHGGGNQCEVQDCRKKARGGSKRCHAHGGGRRCSMLDCNNAAVGKAGLCINHGGGKRCKHPDCGNGAKGKVSYCIKHGGGLLCKIPGCKTAAIGSLQICIAHGGGKRCKSSGCTKSARGSYDFCIGHGGGKRCTIGSCKSVVVGSSGLCYRHGGRGQCAKEGCFESRLGTSKYRFCREHTPNDLLDAFDEKTRKRKDKSDKKELNQP
mmetsp:Transcript_19483/g.23696  ORF Transcript_19483/g.23696 Transcript_19483/m.23696 type:complete len:418 (+) Transcript_19483:19-1272(+)